MTSRTLVWGRQPMTRPVRATMSAHRAAVDRSARDRPTRTAARHMGRVRKRSMTPLLRSVLSPTAVGAAVLTLLWTWLAVTMSLGLRIDGQPQAATAPVSFADWKGLVAVAA